jgi:NADH-quinone oxidoreductase subunit G
VALGQGKVAGLVGDLAPVEAAFALKHLVEGLGGVVECRVDGAALPPGNRGAYAGTARIEDIDTADGILLIGTNPRDEAPVLNARIRKAWLRGAWVGLIGPAADLTYSYDHLGTGREALAPALAAGRQMTLARPLVVLGQGAIRDADGAAVMAFVARMCAETGAGLLVLHTAAARVGAMDVGAVTEGGLPAALAGAATVWALGVDEVDIPAGPTVIYQGSHGDRGAHRADIILPAAAWTEENGLFVNTEGRPQLAFRASFPPGEAKENWAIIRAVSGAIGRAQPWDSLDALRRALVAAVPHLGAVDTVPANRLAPLPEAPLGTGPFAPAVADFYLTNPIARASALMAELSAMAAARARLPLAAE